MSYMSKEAQLSIKSRGAQAVHFAQRRQTMEGGKEKEQMEESVVGCSGQRKEPWRNWFHILYPEVQGG